MHIFKSKQIAWNIKNYDRSSIKLMSASISLLFAGEALYKTSDLSSTVLAFWRSFLSSSIITVKASVSSKVQDGSEKLAENERLWPIQWPLQRKLVNLFKCDICSSLQAIIVLTLSHTVRWAELMHKNWVDNDIVSNSMVVINMLIEHQCQQPLKLHITMGNFLLCPLHIEV